MINNNNNGNIIPVVSYHNANISKHIILYENKGRSGIYRLNNLITNKSYIGSSISLSKRFSNYYSLAFLNRKVEKGSSAIYSALLKYSYSNFGLDILEYCEISELIPKEQYYIDLFKPKYNILKVAGSRLGTKHTEATKKLLSNAFRGRIFSEDSLDKMRLAAKLRVGKKTSFFGKTHTIDTIAKISLRKSMFVKILDVSTDIVKTFRGNLEAANYLDMGESTLRRYKKKGKLFKNKYLIFNSKDVKQNFVLLRGYGLTGKTIISHVIFLGSIPSFSNDIYIYIITAREAQLVEQNTEAI